MPDREKVINGLKICSIQNDLGCQCCPYFEDRKKYGHEWCTTTLVQDALALLKEQEAKTVIKIAKRFNDCDLTGFCPFCSRPLIKDWAEKYCGYCGNPVLWEGR